MNKVLKATSKVLYIDFNNYQEGRFCVQKNTSLKIRIHLQLTLWGMENMLLLLNPQKFETRMTYINIINLLSKCVLGSAFNTPERSMNSFTRTYILPGEMATGWSCNYDEVKKERAARPHSPSGHIHSGSLPSARDRPRPEFYHE